MENNIFYSISESIVAIVLLLIVLSVIILPILMIFYKGRKVEVVVLDKFKNQYMGLNNSHTRFSPTNCYYAKCKFIKTGKIKTLFCSFYTYEKLKVGKSYCITVKLKDIKKIHQQQHY